MTEAAMFTSPMARKKHVEARYNPNTYRVISHEAEQSVPSRMVEFQPVSRINVIGQFPTPDARDHRKNRPNATHVGFLSQDVKLLNEPVCDVHTKATRTEQNAWWPHIVSDEKLKQPEHTLDTTFRKDFQYRGTKVAKNSRHGANPNKEPVLGSVPVNFLREKDGKQRFWKEGISYEHQYNCRLDPQYPIRSKRHGAFVWDRFPTTEVNRMLHHYGILADKNEQTSVSPVQKPNSSSKTAGSVSSSNKEEAPKSPVKSAPPNATTSTVDKKPDSIINTVQCTPEKDSGQVVLPSIF